MPFPVEDHPPPNADSDARSTHVVYRVVADLRYEETPCFCPARSAHSILDARDTTPGAEATS